MAKKVKKNKKSKQVYQKSIHKKKNKDQETDNIKLFVGVPARGSVHIQWAIAIFELMRTLGYQTQIMSTDEIPLSRARNRIVRQFMDSECTHLCWIDADTIPPSDGVHRLFRSLKEYRGQKDTKRFDVMSGLYFSRKKSGWYRPIAFQKLDLENKEHIHYYMWGRTPFQADAIGMGFCIIPRYVFDKLELPYYKWVSDPTWGYLKSDEGSLSFGEDMYFCEKVRGAGFTIGVDPLCQCGHVGMSIVTGEDYQDQIRLGRFGTTQLLSAMNTGDKLLNPEQKQIIAELMEYTGLGMKEVVRNLVNGYKMVKNTWNKKCPRSDREIYDFYATTGDYIYDLASFNYFNGSQIELNDKLVRRSHGRILDYGAGIGAYLIKCYEQGLTDLTHYDVPGPVMDFAGWRYKQRGMKVHMVEAPLDIERDDPLEGVFNTITCIDTMEHLRDPVKHLRHIRKHFDITDDNSVMNVNMSPPDKDRPMHFRHDTPLDEMLKKVFSVVTRKVEKDR